MKIGDSKDIGGERYHLLKDGVNKAEAVRAVNWQRTGGSKARIEKVKRGYYRVWVGGKLPR